MAREYNSEGIKMMSGWAGRWNEPALPEKGSCALCYTKLCAIGATEYCIGCKAIYIPLESGLLRYIGKKS